MIRRAGGTVLAVAATLAACAVPARAATHACAGVVPIAVALPAGVPSPAGDCGDLPVRLQSAAVSGEFGYAPVRFPSCAQGDCAGLTPWGSDALRCLITRGSACCLDAGDPVRALRAGQTPVVLAALDQRWSDDADQRDGICFDSYSGSGERVLRLPVTATLSPAAGDLAIQDFVTAFVVSKPRPGPLELQFLPAIALPVHPPTWGTLRTRYR